MYAQLGNIVFKGLKGFDGFQSKRETNFAQHAVIEGKPKLQRVGTNLEEISLSIQFHASFCTPETEIAALESARSSAEILSLVAGTGEFLGTFVIQSIQKTVTELGADGSIKLCSLDVQLLESSDADPVGSAITAAIGSGFANAINNPSKVVNVPRIQSEAGNIAAPISKAKSLSGSVTSTLAKAKSIASQAQHQAKRAQSSLREMRTQLEKANQAITDAKQVYQSAARMKEAIADSKNAIAATIAALQGGSIDDALVANRELQRAVSRTSSASSEVVNITAMRR